MRAFSVFAIGTMSESLAQMRMMVDSHGSLQESTVVHAGKCGNGLFTISNTYREAKAEFQTNCNNPVYKYNTDFCDQITSVAFGPGLGFSLDDVFKAGAPICDSIDKLVDAHNWNEQQHHQGLIEKGEVQKRLEANGGAASQNLDKSMTRKAPMAGHACNDCCTKRGGNEHRLTGMKCKPEQHEDVECDGGAKVLACKPSTDDTTCGSGSQCQCRTCQWVGR